MILKTPSTEELAHDQVFEVDRRLYSFQADLKQFYCVDPRGKWPQKERHEQDQNVKDTSKLSYHVKELKCFSFTQLLL